MHAVGDYKTILVATDFSELSQLGVRAGVQLAENLQVDRLHVVHIVSLAKYDLVVPHTYSPKAIETIFARHLESAQAKLNELFLSYDPSKTTREARLLPSPVRGIASVATEIAADLIVLASHGRGAFRRAVLGSVASALIRTAPCPVLIVREAQKRLAAFKKVLAAVDLSPVSKSVISQAIMMAKASEGSPQVVSVVGAPMVVFGEEALLITPDEIDSMRASRRKSVEELVNKATHDSVGVRIETPTKSTPAETILDLAKSGESDLIVLGTSGHGMLHRMLLGSTATRVIANALCPVLVVPSGEAT